MHRHISQNGAEPGGEAVADPGVLKRGWEVHGI